MSPSGSPLRTRNRPGGPTAPRTAPRAHGPTDRPEGPRPHGPSGGPTDRPDGPRSTPAAPGQPRHTRPTRGDTRPTRGDTRPHPDPENPQPLKQARHRYSPPARPRARHGDGARGA